MIYFQYSPLVSGWTKAQVIVEGIGAVGAVGALLYSLHNFTKTMRDSYYVQLDRMYFDLLRMVIERPYLLDFSTATSADGGKMREYDAFAFMVWNFVETIYDRCEGDEHLCETWYPIIENENELHRTWFDEDRNRRKFKPKFVEFIVQKKYERRK